MVKFIESELILLKKEVDEMWTLVYNQLDRAGEAVMTLDKELAQQVMVRERRVNAFELKIDSDIEDIIALYNPVAIDLRFVLAMLELAKRALNEENIEMATVVFGKDNLLDDINAEATGILADYIREHPETAHTCVDLVGVFRKLERSGDHITNIAEEIVFFIDAKVLKHSGKVDENYPKS